MIVNLNPKVTSSNPRIIGFKRGETKRKTIVGPKPAFAFSMPFNIGIVEQLQKGVIAPMAAATQ